MLRFTLDLDISIDAAKTLPYCVFENQTIRQQASP
jgi:hypothetical protein